MPLSEGQENILMAMYWQGRLAIKKLQQLDMKAAEKNSLHKPVKAIQNAEIFNEFDVKGIEKWDIYHRKENIYPAIKDLENRGYVTVRKRNFLPPILRKLNRKSEKLGFPRQRNNMRDILLTEAGIFYAKGCLMAKGLLTPSPTPTDSSPRSSP